MIALTRRSFVTAAALLISAGRNTFAAATQPAARPPFILDGTTKREDSVEISVEGESATLTVTCPSGIGDARLKRIGTTWGKGLTVRFRYKQDRPFDMLESFDASLTNDDLRKPAEKDLLHLKVTGDGRKGMAQVTFPANANEYTWLWLDWIDAFRR